MDKNKEIMEIVNQINDEDAGILGFSIADSIDSYEETGRNVLTVFQNHPEHAEILEKMLIAVCGWGIESLQEKIEDNRTYYDAL